MLKELRCMSTYRSNEAFSYPVESKKTTSGSPNISLFPLVLFVRALWVGPAGTIGFSWSDVTSGYSLELLSLPFSYLSFRSRGRTGFMVKHVTPLSLFYILTSFPLWLSILALLSLSVTTRSFLSSTIPHLRVSLNLLFLSIRVPGTDSNNPWV